MIGTSWQFAAPFAALFAALLGGCGKPRSAAYLVKVSGDGQVGIAGSGLPQPLIVKTTDMAGDAVGGVAVLWRVLEGEGTVSAERVVTASDGTAAVAATLGPTATTDRFAATTYGLFGSPVIFTASRSPFKLAYTDPAAAGKLRLVKRPDATDSSVTLELLVAPGVIVSAYSAGFNLPLDPSKVGLDGAAPMQPGKALDPGSEPVAALSVLPTSGPLKGVLVTGQSQKAAGPGAVFTDTKLTEGAVLYSIKLNLLPGATPGPVFDGTAPGFGLRSGGLRDRQGTAVVQASELAIGKLEVVK